MKGYNEKKLWELLNHKEQRKSEIENEINKLESELNQTDPNSYKHIELDEKIFKLKNELKYLNALICYSKKYFSKLDQIKENYEKEYKKFFHFLQEALSDNEP